MRAILFFFFFHSRPDGYLFDFFFLHIKRFILFDFYFPTENDLPPRFVVFIINSWRLLYPIVIIASSVWKTARGGGSKFNIIIPITHPYERAHQHTQTHAVRTPIASCIPVSMYTQDGVRFKIGSRRHNGWWKTTPSARINDAISDFISSFRFSISKRRF